MKTAFVIFNRMTALDFIGTYDPLTRLTSMQLMPDFEWDICALTMDVVDDKGLCIAPSVVGQPLSDYDLLVVPGGIGSRTLQHNKAFIDWLRTSEPVKLKASVCTGALLLGAAGFLKDKRATTHPNAFEELRPHCAHVVDDRVVDEGGIITARGVTSAIDLGLYLVERFAGAEARARIANQMDYPYVWQHPGKQYEVR
ncbi:MAG: DJ-1/PfpI family protein [Nitrospira sp.]|nr:DJ-1/PfpI family protein [Nitrospira sp.]